MTVGIVGAGITGLAAAHHLHDAGVETVVLEASDRPGGVLESHEVEGRVIDLGPQRTRLTPSIRNLVAAVGLEDDLLLADEPPVYVYRDGRLRRVPKSARAAATTDLLSWRGKLRVLLEPFTGPPRPDETVREFLVRAFGREAADYLIGPLYAGLYGSHPDEMYVRHSLGRALAKIGTPRSLLLAGVKRRVRGREGPPVASFEAGLDALPQALADEHAERVELDTAVTGIRRDGGSDAGGDAGGNGGESSGRFRLETPGETVAVDHVVLTTPADVTADLLAEVDPETAGALDRLTYNPFVVVHVETAGHLDAAGFQVQFDEDFAILGATSNAGLFPGEPTREHLATCYLGGSRNPDLVERDENVLGDLAAREFETVTGIAAEPLHVHTLPRGMPAYDTSWTALAGVDPPAGIDLCANYESRAGIPGRVAGARRLADRLAGRLGDDGS